MSKRLNRKNRFKPVGIALTCMLLFSVPLSSVAETILVNSTDDNTTGGDSLCTFREAVINSNTDTDASAGDCLAGSGTDSIEFSEAGTYLMDNAEMGITDSVNINSDASLAITLQANAVHLSGIRGFHILNGADVLFNKVVITGGRGGGEGHRIFDAGTVTFQDSTIAGTSSRYGAGVRIGSTDNATSVIFDRSIVRNNTNRNGGTIVFTSSGDLTILNSSIRNNSMVFNGGGANGGVYIGGQSGVITIEESTISANADRSGDGSGGLRYQAGGGSLTLTNTTISGNVSTLNGGGLYLDSSQPVVLNHVTISNNRSNGGLGGGVYVAPTHTGPITLNSTLLAGNSNAAGPDDIQLNGTSVTSAESLVDYTDGVDNVAVLLEDIAIGPLGNNGGLTATHSIGASSIAVDAGGLSDFSRNGHDQRGPGFSRQIGDAIDVGAIERPSLVLLHHWPFDDEPDTALADVAGDADGVLAASGDFFDTGVSGGSLKLFSGDSVLLNAADINSIWTLAFWVRSDQANSQSTLLSSPAGSILLEVEGRRRNVGATTTAAGNVEFNYSLPLNQDTHLVMINRGSRSELYANGVLVDTIDKTFLLPLETIGNSTNKFTGRLDDLRVYNGDLTVQQVTDLYDTALPLHSQQADEGFSCNVTSDSDSSNPANFEAADLLFNGNAQDITVNVGEAVVVAATVKTDNGTVNGLAVELVDERTDYTYCENGNELSFTRVFVEPGVYPIRLKVTESEGAATEIEHTVTVNAGGVALIDGVKGEHYQFTESREPWPDFSSLVAATSPPQVPLSTKENSRIYNENEPLYTRVYYAINSTGDFWNNLSQGVYFPDLANPSNHAVRWSGKLRINRSGEHEFSLTNNDRAQLYINNDLLIDNSVNGIGDMDIAQGKATVTLQAGMHDFRLELYDPADEARRNTEITLRFKEPGDNDSRIVPSDRFYHEISVPDADLDVMRTLNGRNATVIALEAYETARLHPGNETQVRRDRIDALQQQFIQVPFGAVGGLLHPTSNAGATGANYAYKIGQWLDYMRATNSPVSYDWYHAILNDMASYKTASNPGMRPDGLWFQHAARGLQIHHDGYGIDASNRIFGGAFADTRWAQTETQFRAKADFVTTADWFFYKGNTDRRVSGRWNFGVSGYPARVASIAQQVLNGAALDPATRQDVETTRDRLQLKAEISPLSGNRFFYSGLLGVHRTSDWYIATKLVNHVVAGPETFAWAYNKNVQYGIGQTEIWRSGEELGGNFKTVQNHSALAGITHEFVADVAFDGYHGYRGRQNTIAGGVSDGRLGAATFEMNLTDQFSHSVVAANKSYFTTTDGLVALGSQVRTKRSSSSPIYTTVNQVRLLSDIVFDLDDGAGEQTVEMGAGDTDLVLSATKPAWFHHDGIGYVVVPLTDPVKFRLFAEERTSSLKKLTSLSGSEDEVTEKVFQLSIDHGVDPTDQDYLYYVLPGMSLEDMPAYVSDLPITVLSNDANIQAIHDTRNAVTYSAFHSAAELRSGDAENRLLLAVDRPAVAMLKDINQKRMVYVADAEHYVNTDPITLQVGKPDGTVENRSVTPPSGFDGNRRGDQVELDIDIRPAVSVEVDSNLASENPLTAGQFRVLLSSPNTSTETLVITYSLSGTAQAGTHYNSAGNTIQLLPGESSALVEILPIDDDATTGDTTVILTLDESAVPEGVTLGSPVGAMLTIKDDDTPPTTNPDPVTDPVTDPVIDPVTDPVTDPDKIDGDSNAPPIDTDLDGQPDKVDLDIDGDGLTNLQEGDGDTDSDGIPDERDLDSDNDGVPDIVEAQGQNADLDRDGRVDNIKDLDGDGLDDSLALAPVSLPDTDNDGIPDYRDIDADGDGVPDYVESNTLDLNRDGVLDSLEDSDKDGIPDYADVDSTGGTDVDADGIDDTVDADFFTEDDTDGDGIIDSRDADANGDGIIDDLPLAAAELQSPVTTAGKGGGCSVSPSGGRIDPLFLLMLLLAAARIVKLSFREKLGTDHV